MSKRAYPCMIQESVGHNNATHVVEIEAADLINAEAGAAQDFAVLDGKDQVQVAIAQVLVDRLFEDEADAAFDEVAVIVGDAGNTARFLASLQVAANNAAPKTVSAGTGTTHIYMSDAPVNVRFTPKAGKALANLKKGRIRIYFRVKDGNSVLPDDES